MLKIFKQAFSIISIMLIVVYMTSPFALKVKASQSTNTLNSENVVFSDCEEDMIVKSQETPVKMGIIPHTFPLSACPPEVSTFKGINVEMLEYVMKISGIKFQYIRVPTETKSPYQALMDDTYMFVAGSIKLDVFVENPNIILSKRFSDGSAICIANRDTNPETLITGKIAVMKGYQAGVEFSEKQFPNHEIVFYPTNDDVMVAVRTGKADLAMISRYVGVYKLQSPLNEDLMPLTPYQMLTDSCIMGKNTPDSNVIMSIIDKVIGNMSEGEYNNLQMNYTISNPYVLSLEEILYKSRYGIIIGLVLFFVFAFLLSRLLYTQKERKTLLRDELTGAMSEAGFELTAAKIIARSTKPLFMTDFDICYFSNYNELFGKAKGDLLLKNIVKIVKSFLCEKDMICRSYADNFKVLTCKDDYASLKQDIVKASELFNGLLDRKMIFNFGVYPISDKTIPISKMLDFAALAKKQVKGNVEDFVGVFGNELYERQRQESNLIADFGSAIANHEFIAHYQPKYDVHTKKIVGAEALVRWKKSDGTLVSPGQFIDLFERNGQLQRLDMYMIEQVCIFQRKILSQGIRPLPISVNFSRNHFYTTEFVSKVNKIVEQYEIPRSLVEIECTETAITYDTSLAKEILATLRKQGFTVAMDDFGKAYSSLNSLRSIPLDILKLDSEFMNATLESDKIKAKMIISNMISLGHDLSLKIVAEGVETESQYKYLKSVGCDYIQGYYFSKPLCEEDYLSQISQLCD